MAFERLSSYVTETGVDSRNLVRWTYLKISNAYKTVWVVMVYRPCMPSSIRRRGEKREGGTVWEQHDRYCRALGEVRDPLEMFNADLLRDLREWKKWGRNYIDGRFQSAHI